MHNLKIGKSFTSTFQKIINREYERKGLTDNVLKAQLALNEFRTKHDIVLDEEIITDDGFLQ